MTTQTNLLPADIRKEVEGLDTTSWKPVERGMKNARARLVQEWLCLNGHSVQVDGDFGPGTQAGVIAFQKANGLGTTGAVNKVTFGKLVAPMLDVVTLPASVPSSLPKAVLAVARRHLKQHPREVGGQNMGPWVRLYMKGHQGNAYPWCAGFVSFVLAQAVAAAGLPMPVKGSFSCDVLADQAKRAGCSRRARRWTARQVRAGYSLIGARPSTGRTPAS